MSKKFFEAGDLVKYNKSKKNLLKNLLDENKKMTNSKGDVKTNSNVLGEGSLGIILSSAYTNKDLARNPKLLNQNTYKIWFGSLGEWEIFHEELSLIKKK
jgi:hypothetical protein